MVCVIPLAQTFNRIAGCSPFRQLNCPDADPLDKDRHWEARTPAIWRLSIIPAYFVANARPKERSMDTHSCSVITKNVITC